MRKLIEQVQREAQEINEVSWRQVAGGAAIAGALVTGTPDVSHAMTHRHHAHHAHHNYSEQDIINTIVGEESQSYRGMVAVACAIRNRMHVPYYKNDILRGAYGRTADHVKRESPKVFEEARRAWAESLTHDITNGAYLWGYGPDIRRWTAEAEDNPNFWFNNVEPTVRVGSNTFFRDRPKREVGL